MSAPLVSTEQLETVICRMPDALRRTSREERQRFGSPWIVVYRRRWADEDANAT